jgi:hypothetical protein
MFALHPNFTHVTNMKTFFVVERDVLGRVAPRKYHEQIPLKIKKKIVWAIRLDDPAVAELPIEKLFKRYNDSVELGALPDSNLVSCDYWTMMT